MYIKYREYNYSSIILLSQRNTYYFSENNIFYRFANHLREIRDVAQPGSVLVWGTRGRGFKSRHPDHLLKNECFKLFFY